MTKSKFAQAGISAYGTILGIACLTGLGPAALSYFVDPYEMFAKTDHPKAYKERAEKAHYPLWKFAHFNGQAKTVILGDSRARALRDKYWHEFGESDAYNFAYGGGTIPEIYATFNEIKDNPHLQTIVVGIQLRSFDENHKGGLNRVPEAVRATSSSANYLKNWFVARKSWDFFKQKNGAAIDMATGLLPSMIGSARAADLGQPGTTGVATLLQPDVCFGCDFPEHSTGYYLAHSKGPNLGLGRGGRFDIWGSIPNLPQRTLPAKFESQITKNARSDWKAFSFSPKYMSMMAEMAAWADAKPNRNLVFVVPPTIVEMQNTISAYGLQSLNLSFRRKLAALAPVIDFDFPSEKTKEQANFSDAYHFNSKFARQIVGEVISVLGADPKQAKVIAKRRKGIECPTLRLMKSVLTSDLADFAEGDACRVWMGGNHG